VEPVDPSVAPGPPPAAPPAPPPDHGPPPDASGDGAAAAPPRLPWHPVWVALGAALLLALTAIGGASLARAPYVVYAPGSAIETEPAIATPGSRSYETEGSVLFLTVSLRGASRRVSFAEAAYGWVRGDQDVFPRRQILGDQSGAESRQQSLQLMQGSQLLAAKVALEHLGHEVTATGEGAVVNTVSEGTPAAAELRPGDVIIGIDGRSVALDSELRDLLVEKQPGDTVELELRRGAALVRPDDAPEPEVDTVVVEMVPDADPGGRPRAVIGITTFTMGLDYELPFPVEIDTEDVGGPSAGLALTLGILDRLTPGSITGGRDIAVTGEIGPDGQVVQVGGVAQKAAAARAAGVALILVPAEEAAEARAHAGSVPVVGVATLDEALRALDDLGGNALDLPRDGG